MDGTVLAAGYRFFYRYSGVMMLVALLFATPWLPVSPDETAARPATTAVNPNVAGPIFQASRPPAKFTVHVVASAEEVVNLQTLFPDAQTDLIFTVLPGEEALFLSWSDQINSVRRDVNLPPLLLRDYRCDPQTPEPSLCAFKPALN